MGINSSAKYLQISSRILLHILDNLPCENENPVIRSDLLDTFNFEKSCWIIEASPRADFEIFVLLFFVMPREGQERIPLYSNLPISRSNALTIGIFLRLGREGGFLRNSFIPSPPLPLGPPVQPTKGKLPLAKTIAKEGLNRRKVSAWGSMY